MERDKQMLKASFPYGTRYGFTSRQQYLDFVAKQPRVLPVVPRPARKLSRSQRVLSVAIWLVLAPLVLVAFLLLGERPTLKA
jgi:hypothetical protein